MSALSASSSSAAPTTSSLSLSLLFQHLRSQRRFMVGGLASGLALGLFIYLVTPTAYEAKAKFLVDRLPLRLTDTATDAETEQQLVQSLIVSIPSIELRQAVEKRVGSLPGSIAFVDIDRAVSLRSNHPRANVTVTPTRHSRLGQISVLSQTPEFAVQVVNAILTELERLNLLAGRITQVDLLLKLTKHRAENLTQQYADLTNERIKLEKQNAELTDYLARARPLEMFPSFSEDPTLHNLKTRIILVQAEYDTLLAQNIRGSRLDSKRFERQSLKNQMAQHAQNLAEALQSQLTINRTQEIGLQADLASLQTEISRAENQRAQFARGFGDSSIRDQIIGDRNLQTENITNVISFVDRAWADKKPVKPILWFNLCLGLILGLSLGVALSLIRHFLDHRVRSPAHLERLTRLPCLAVLPPPAVLPAPQAGHNIFSHPPFSRGLGYLRSQLIRSQQGQTTDQIFGFSPARSQDDCSQSISDLAVLLAQAEKRTLIVDLHFNQPRQAKILGLEPTLGLAEWLFAEDELSDYLTFSPVRELAVLAPGNFSVDSDDLLSRRPLAPALLGLCRHWDFILIDAPPLLDEWHLLLAVPPEHGVIITAEFQRTTTEEILQASQRARTAHLQIRGILLTDFPSQPSPNTTLEMELGYHRYALEARPISPPPS